MVRWIVGALVAASLAGASFFFWQRSDTKAPSWKTAKVDRGDLHFSISATGTVEPEEVVDVGAQVAGQIKSLGVDPRDANKSVDYTTPVDVGTVLAKIDDSLYASDVDQAKATVEVAKAGSQRTQADLSQLRAKLTQAERDWKRSEEMKTKPGAISAQELDQSLANYETAKSLLSVGEASAVQAERSVTQAEATLSKAQKNLDYCTIRSPVKGVIVDRRVNVGQTVVSSLNAPSLFLIAKDLRRLQVWVSVNEADIGQISAGQPATFTVDAYPGRTFRGEVGKIRLNAAMTQNVVTYTVEVNTDNSDGKLLPYLTANLQFEIGHRDKVLRVPNAALRYWPQPAQIKQVHQETKDSRVPNAQAVSDNSEIGTLWVADGIYVRPIKVRIGGSDGTLTEVSGDDLSDGMEVVTGEGRTQSTGKDNSNPFAPKIFGGSKSS